MTTWPMFAIEARSQKAHGEEILWFRKLDSHWTHHATRVQYYGRDEAETIMDALPVIEGRTVRIVPATDVPS